MTHYVVCPVCNRKIQRRQKARGWEFVPAHAGITKQCPGRKQQGFVVVQAEPDVFLKFATKGTT